MLRIVICFLLIVGGLWENALATPQEGDGENSTPFAEINDLAREEISPRLKSFGFGLMGDSIDTHTGTIVFSQTDVSLPGNSHLPVAITRSTSGRQITYGNHRFMADWKLDVPSISMLVASYRGWKDDRCTGEIAPPDAYNYGVHYRAEEYSDGMKMQIPGQGTKTILEGGGSTELRWSGISPQKVTKDHWGLTCISDIGDGSEGFIAHAPNGDKYTFDKLHLFTADGYVKGSILGRKNATLFASEVTDVNGNWVKYEYNSGNLVRIHANDGREITIGYSTENDLIASVTANARTWTYEYSDTLASYDRNLLAKVTQPDGRYWSYDFSALDLAKPGAGACTYPDQSITMTHPYGVSAVFELGERRHGRTGVPYYYAPAASSGCGFGLGFRINPFMETISVTKKTLSGSGIPNSIWEYSYEEDNGNFETGEHSYSYPPSLADTKITTVKQPSGVVTEYHHNRRWGWTYGQLSKTVTRASNNGTILSNTENIYLDGGGFGSYELFNADIENLSHASYLSQSVTTQNNETYTSKTTYDVDASSSDYSYGLPLTQSIYSSVSLTPRVTTTEYEHNTSKWILGLPKTIDINGREVASYIYDPVTGQKSSQTRYGEDYATFDYNADGTLHSIKDALDRETQASNYYRGTPQEIIRAYGTSDQTSASRTVDDNGWVTSSTDAKGYTTTYDYDIMGRVKTITPEQSLRAWTPTTITYNFSGGGAVQTIKKGQSEQTITYDALFRPTLEQSKALDTGQSVFTNTRYDAMGRVEFASASSASSTETLGTHTVYDGLGRVDSVTALGETTSYDYLSNNRESVTDPEGNTTTYSYDGYSGPGTGELLKIIQPEGVQTWLTRNEWGQLTRVDHGGMFGDVMLHELQLFKYDDQQRLCRHRTREGHDTVMEYDAAGQMIAYAKGMITNSCEVPQNDKRVDMSYDALGRLELTDFTDTDTPDITVTYDENSNVLTTSRGALTSPDLVQWDYSYDELGQLKSETLYMDNRVFNLGYNYNDHGQMWKRNITGFGFNRYSYDGVGRMTDVRYAANDNFIAQNAAYHPSGPLASMSLGNGGTYSQSLNARLLPQRATTATSAGTILDLGYQYDGRGKVTDITDHDVTGLSKTFTYDDLGRLTAATGPWGVNSAQTSASYLYDTVGNIRQKVVGDRTVDMGYDNRNRLNIAIDSHGPERNPVYDKPGNVVQLAGMVFDYDKTNQPVSVSGTADSGAALNGNYVYDGNLKRVKAEVDGQTIYNVYDISGALVMVDAGDKPGEAGSAKATLYINGPNGTLARVTKDSGGQESITYMHNDHLGSASAATDGNGAIEWTEQYSPYGLTMQDPAANDNEGGFTGHIKDKATGLNYMQARYYDPVIGRFLSIDPVDFMSTGDPRMFNRYAYGYNDPINMLDNDGRKPEHVQDRVSQGIRAARQNPQSGIRVAAGAVAVSAAAAGIGAAAVTAAPAAAAACSATCATIAVGASAGTLVEGANQLEKGEFSAGKLAASAAVGAAGGAGSLTGKTIAGQMAGAAISAGLAGSTVEMLNQGANGTVDGVGVVAAGAKAGAGAALGAGAGNLAGRALTGASGFGGAGNLSTGGAALGASIGEAGSATTMDVIDDRLEDF